MQRLDYGPKQFPELLIDSMSFAWKEKKYILCSLLFNQYNFIKLTIQYFYFQNKLINSRHFNH